MISFPPPSNADIQRVVDLVVETVRPERVVLFGSAARGEAQDGSDVDMMVVVADGSNELAIAKQLYLELGRRRVGVGVDFVVTTSTRFERQKARFWSVFHDVARDGRELYVA
jgi:predicted nucleotidyltransferase